ncbi:MAG: ABC transporter permease [Hyphomicrobiaceae bacterium]
MAEATLSSTAAAGEAPVGQYKAFDVKRMPGFILISVFVFVLLYAPVILLVVFSFNEGESLAVWQGTSLKWYIAASGNDDIKMAAFRSLYVAIFAGFVSTTAATMAAIATTRVAAFRGMMPVYGLINMPLMVPEIVTGVALLITFAWVKEYTQYFGMGYIIAAHTAFCIPFAYLPIRARLESMDLTLERAAADLYATPWQAFKRVTLPLLWPGILAGFMLAFVISLDDVVITDFVKSAGQETLPTYMLGQLRRQVTPEINAIASVFFALSVVMVTMFYFLNRKK